MWLPLKTGVGFHSLSQVTWKVLDMCGVFSHWLRRFPRDRRQQTEYGTKSESQAAPKENGTEKHERIFCDILCFFIFSDFWHHTSQKKSIYFSSLALHHRVGLFYTWQFISPMINNTPTKRGGKFCIFIYTRCNHCDISLTEKILSKGCLFIEVLLILKSPSATTTLQM